MNKFFLIEFFVVLFLCLLCSCSKKEKLKIELNNIHQTLKDSAEVFGNEDWNRVEKLLGVVVMDIGNYEYKVSELHEINNVIDSCQTIIKHHEIERATNMLFVFY